MDTESDDMRRKLLTAEDVEMQMRYGLCGIGSAVGDDAVTTRSACFFGDHGDLLEDVRAVR